MGNEYPTEEELKRIESWSGLFHDQNIDKFLTYLQGLWHWDDYFKRKGKNVIHLELHTGGWSGNEELIDSLHKAFGGMFWYFYWVKSTRGGHYWFRIPLKQKKKK